MIDKTSIRELKGIGDKTQKLFEKVGVSTVGDLIRYYPRGYDVYEDPVPISEVEEDRTQTISGAIYGRVQVSGNAKMQVTTLYVKDLTGTLKVIWFRRCGCPSFAVPLPEAAQSPFGEESSEGGTVLY